MKIMDNEVKFRTFDAFGKTYKYRLRSGAIELLEPKTIDSYIRIVDSYPDTEKLAVFFAFNNKQFDEGYAKLVESGQIKSGEKIMYVKSVGGLLGTERGLADYFDFFAKRTEYIKDHCDPQEVYIYEWNNHECMVTNDDFEAFCTVANIWGEDVAGKITRFGLLSGI